MPNSKTAQEVYEQMVKDLPAAERLRLVERIVHDLSAQPDDGKSPQERDLLSLGGIAPGLLDGEDAQEWVSRARRESDEHRDKQCKHLL